MSKANIIIGSIVVVAFAYPLVMRALAVRMQPTRLKMHALGKELLHSTALSVSQKKMIESMLADAYSPRFMLAASLVVPIYIFKVLFFGRSGRSPLSHVHVSVAPNIKKFQNYHLRATATANPICALVLAVEFLLLWLPLRLLGFLDGNSGGTNVRSDVRNLASEVEAERSHAY